MKRLPLNVNAVHTAMRASACRYLRQTDWKSMIWVAPSEKDIATDMLEKRLSAAADQFHANSGLRAAQYSQAVLGLIFLGFAGVRSAKQRAKLERSFAVVALSFRLIDRLHLQIQNIRRTRDLLLARLLSGQIFLTTKEHYATNH
jgi:hypothetical protein